MPGFSSKLEKTLHRALALAAEHRHEFATLEHLLLALTEDDDGIAVMNACSVNIDELRQDLDDHLEQELAGLILEKFDEPKPTAGFQRVVQRALIHV